MGKTMTATSIGRGLRYLDMYQGGSSHRPIAYQAVSLLFMPFYLGLGLRLV